MMEHHTVANELLFDGATYVIAITNDIRVIHELGSTSLIDYLSQFYQFDQKPCP